MHINFLNKLRKHHSSKIKQLSIICLPCTCSALIYMTLYILYILFSRSNGVGRSGVFIALHIALERLIVEGQSDIFQTVKNLRIQRPAMVQSLVRKINTICHKQILFYSSYMYM